MRLLRYLALLGIVMLPATYSHSQVSIGIGVGGPVYGGTGYYAPPVCSYGYYAYYPYACAPYGYYGPSWFSGGVFIGAGPWLRGGYGYRGYRYRGYGYRGYGYRSAYGYGHPGYYSRGRAVYGGGYRGGARGGFHGGEGFHGGGGHGRR